MNKKYEREVTMQIAGVEFKPVKKYEQFYEVSTDGAIFSKITKRFRKQIVNSKTGYSAIVLCNPETKEHKTVSVHRIVAETWIPNPNNYPCINHINENKLDNHVSNLEWCTKAYNNAYNNKTQRCCKAIYQIDIKTNAIIKIWKSAREAAPHFNTNYKNISAVCRGKRKSAGGYKWRFA